MYCKWRERKEKLNVLSFVVSFSQLFSPHVFKDSHWRMFIKDVLKTENLHNLKVLFSLQNLNWFLFCSTFFSLSFLSVQCIQRDRTMFKTCFMNSPQKKIQNYYKSDLNRFIRPSKHFIPLASFRYPTLFPHPLKCQSFLTSMFLSVPFSRLW